VKTTWKITSRTPYNLLCLEQFWMLSSRQQQQQATAQQQAAAAQLPAVDAVLPELRWLNSLPSMQQCMPSQQQQQMHPEQALCQWRPMHSATVLPCLCVTTATSVATKPSSARQARAQQDALSLLRCDVGVTVCVGLCGSDVTVVELACALYWQPAWCLGDTPRGIESKPAA
jgi:hypothetical protein